MSVVLSGALSAENRLELRGFMGKEDTIEAEGTVLEPLPNAMF